MRAVLLAIVLVAAPVHGLAQRIPLAADPAATAGSRLPAGVMPAVLAALVDTAQLSRIERQHHRSTHADTLMLAGFAALRLWELTDDRRHARRARRHFSSITDRDPSHAAAHYAFGLGLVGDVEQDPEPGEIVFESNALAFFGLDALSRARRALERAVQLDPTLPGAVELLARFARETRDRDALLLAWAALEQAASSATPDISVLLELSATARHLGDYEAAAGAAARAMADSGASFPLAAYAHAHALALREGADNEVGASYLRAVAALEQYQWQWLRADMLPLLDAETLSSVDQLDVESRRAWLLRFWRNRAAAAGVPQGDRIAEHFRRLHQADTRYVRRGMYGAPSLNALSLRSLSTRFDDRGVILVRHGEPFRIIPVRGSYDTRGWEQESWVYRRDDGSPVMYHFERVSDSYSPMEASVDFVLMRNLRCADGFAEDRVQYDQSLAPLLGSCSPAILASVSADVRKHANRALSSDSYRPSYGATLPFHYDLYTFRGLGGRTDVVAAVSLRVGDVDTVLLRFSVADTAADMTTRVEKLAPVPEMVRDSGLARTYLSLWAAPSASSFYRINAEDRADKGRGMVYGGALDVRSYAGDTLMVSDVLLAEPAASGTFIRGEQALTLAPTQVFRDGEFRVFYEIYNLAAGQTYRTSVEVEPSGDGLRATVRRIFGRDQPVRLIFDGTAPEGGTSTLQESRLVTAPFPAGTYVLSLTVSTADGRSIRRERRFVVETQP